MDESFSMSTSFLRSIGIFELNDDEDSLEGITTFLKQPDPQLECMIFSTLLTPPMEEIVTIPDVKDVEVVRNYNRLPKLSPHEQERVYGLNSLLIDEFIADHPMNVPDDVRIFFAKSRKYFVQYTEDMRMLYEKYKFNTMKRRIFFGMSKECHCVLLANDWTGALEIYQKALAYDPDMFQRDAYMYFGIGVIYLHFKQFPEAIESFSRLLYCHPTGRVALESKVRLAACYLELEDYHRCINLLHLAGNDIEESQFMPRLVIKYNIGLCHENLEELDEAMSEYKKCQSDIEIYEKSHGTNIDDKSRQQLVELKAGVLRQIGWVSYRRTYIEEQNKVDLLKEALKNLNLSHELNPVDGKNFYYLGRVYGEQESMISASNINQENNEVAHAAFVNYRQSIDKCEQNADTWCSIGALYLRKNQPMDALQAFICSIELNPQLTAAWTNLGELYERNGQFQDSLDCFRKALQSDPVAPEPIKARVQFLEKELALAYPQRPQNHPIPFDVVIPSLSEAYDQPIPQELRGRQDAAYEKMEEHYDNAYWNLWVDFRTTSQNQNHMMDMGYPEIRPMSELESQVLIMLRRHEPRLCKAEREVLECLETSALVWQKQIMEAVIQDACREMPRVTEEMIQTLQDQGNLLENPKIFPYSFLPKVAFTDLPDSFSLLSEVYVSVDVPGQELIDQISKRCIRNHPYMPIFEEFAKIPFPPKVPKKKIATEEEVKAALEKNERHPLLMKTKIMTVENRKEAGSLDLQRHLEYNSIACVRGVTGCLRLDLSLFSTKALLEIDPNQEIEIRTQYHIAPENNVNHASQKTWKLRSDLSHTTLAKYAQYQADSFRQVLRVEAEKMRKYGGNTRGPSPKRQKLHRRAPSPPKELKSIKFGTNVDLSDEQKYGKHFNELSKLPAFCRLIAGNNMLSHLGHQIAGMNTVSMNMCVPGARVSARQANNNVVTVNINIGPGDCEWFAVPYEYWGKMEKLCQKRELDFFKGTWWPILDELLEEGIPVHQFTQKAGDIVHVGAGSIYWKQATGWCNNIQWCVAPMTYTQLNKSILSYEYNKLRRVKSSIPIQLLCWQMAKNVKFTNPSIYNTCKNVMIRSLAFLKIISDYLQQHKKTAKTHPRANNEPSHFCRTCECEVFGILFVKEISNTFTVFCVYCSKSQGLDDFIVLQQYTLEDLLEVYEKMRYVHTMSKFSNNNSKIPFVA